MNLDPREKKKLLAFETWCYRRMVRISLIEALKNEEVFRRAGEDRSFQKRLKRRRAQSIGHTLRDDNVTKKESYIERWRGKIVKKDYVWNV